MIHAVVLQLHVRRFKKHRKNSQANW